MDTGAKIPVIMLTADATPEAKEASLNAGANRFLTKPVNAHHLLENIASLSRSLDTIDVSQRPKNISRSQIDSKIAESSWYDYTVLHELDILGGDPDFIQSLLENFCKQGMQHVLNIKSTVEDDYPEYRENLHALKGSATELGAGRLVEICLEAESLKPHDIGSDKIARLYTRLEKIFDSTVSALNSAVTNEQISQSGKTTAQQG
jgi:two-component system sensor histidine kinase RpfC